MFIGQLDPENVGIAVEISLPFSVPAEIQVFNVRGRHLGISTSGFFPFGRTTGPRKHRYSRWNFVAILCTSFDIRI